MATSSRHPQWSRRLLAGSIALLLVFSLLPLRFTHWLGALGGPLSRIVAPVTHLSYQASAWMSGGARATFDDPTTDQLQRYETLNRQLSRENQRLRDQIRDLQAGIEYARRPVIPVIASVIARSSDPSSPALTVRAGARHGVQVSDVATVRGVQLVGKVERVTDRTCIVRPVLDSSYGPIGAEVFAPSSSATLDPGATGLRCQLEAAGDVLRGPLVAEFEGDERSPLLPEIGSVVRLSDDVWPESAQMLVVGRVESVDRDEQQPLRFIVTVRPEVDLTRVSEVIVRTSATSGPEGGPALSAGQDGAP